MNLQLQIEAMKSKYPQFKCKRKKDSIVFTGDLLIKPELPIYNVSVEYNGDSRPIVKVNHPQLDMKSPHRYDDYSLCLYSPNDFKWNAEKLIAKEIIPWTTAWLFFYEYWLQSDEWIGPEAPHNFKKNE